MIISARKFNYKTHECRHGIQLSREELIYLFGLFVFFFESIVRITTISINIPSRACQIIVIVCSAISLLINGQISRSRILMLIGVSLLIIIVSAKIGGLNLFVLISLIVAAKNISGKRIIGLALIIHSFFLVVCTILSRVGTIPNYCYDEIRGVRQSLGYLSYNYPSKVCFFCIMYYLYLKSDKLKLIEIVIMIVTSIYYSMATISRTTLYLTSITILAYIILERFHKQFFEFNKSKLICYSYIICAILAFAVQFEYINNPDKLQFLETWSSHRLSITANVISNYGFSLFGQNIIWSGISYDAQVGTQYNYVDSSYLLVFLLYGIFFGGVVLLGMTKLLKNAYVKQDYRLIIILCVLSIRFIMEPQLIDARFNTFLLLIMPSFNNLRIEKRSG